MKTIEELRDFLRSEIKVCRYAVDSAVAHRDYVSAAQSSELLATYRFLLDWVDGKCE